MNLIGNRVQLQGYNGYSGGLDTKLNCTGKESYSTTYESYDCMFHVSPLIPTKKDDLQSLERKRFVGNDVVVLVFKEQNDRDDVFDPSIIHSQFNHVWIIVSPHKTDETNKSYTINVISKCEVLPFPPFLSPSKQLPILPICLHNQDTKEFILKKLINAERSALNTESFLTKSKRVLSYQIDSLINNFV
ncbi:GTPase-activating Rap/Ran-GAP domain-like protein 3 [Entamoeba marina]